LAGLAVIEVNHLDGVKMILEDGSWLLFRVSETKPVVRLYVEAASPERLDRLVTAGENFIGR
jgi:phosphoglucomutase